MPKIVATVEFEIDTPEPFSKEGMESILRGALTHAENALLSAGTGSKGCATVSFRIISETTDALPWSRK